MNVAKTIMKVPPPIIGDNKNMTYTRAYQLLEDKGNEMFSKSSMYYTAYSMSSVKNRDHLSFIGDETKMINVFLVPVKGPNNTVNLTMLHSGFVEKHNPDDAIANPERNMDSGELPKSERKWIGRIGQKFSSPLKQIRITEISKPMSEMNMSSKIDHIVPTLDEIIDLYVFGNGFSDEINKSWIKTHFALIRSEGDPKSRETIKDVLSAYPNCYMIDPAIITYNNLGFLGTEGRNVSELAHLIIQSLLYDRETNRWVAFNKKTVRTFLEPSYNLLIYLWLVGNAFGDPVDFETSGPATVTFRNNRKLVRHISEIGNLFEEFDEADTDTEDYLDLELKELEERNSKKLKRS